MDPVPQVSNLHGVTNVARDGGRQQRRPGGREFEADLDERRRERGDTERDAKPGDSPARRAAVASGRARLQRETSSGRNNRSQGGLHVDVLA